MKLQIMINKNCSLVVLFFTFIIKPGAYLDGIIAGTRRSLAGVTVYKVVSSVLKETMRNTPNDSFDENQGNKENLPEKKDNIQTSKISQIVPHAIGVTTAAIAIDRLLYWDRFRKPYFWGAVVGTGPHDWQRGCYQAIATTFVTLGAIYAIRREIPMSAYVVGAANAIPLPWLEG